MYKELCTRKTSDYSNKKRHVFVPLNIYFTVIPESRKELNEKEISEEARGMVNG
jgi:hypothetical protein